MASPPLPLQDYSLAQAHAGAATVFVDEFDVGKLERFTDSLNRILVTCISPVRFGAKYAPGQRPPFCCATMQYSIGIESMVLMREVMPD